MKSLGLVVVISILFLGETLKVNHMQGVTAGVNSWIATSTTSPPFQNYTAANASGYFGGYGRNRNDLWNASFNNRTLNNTNWRNSFNGTLGQFNQTLGRFNRTFGAPSAMNGTYRNQFSGPTLGSQFNRAYDQFNHSFGGPYTFNSTYGQLNRSGAFGQFNRTFGNPMNSTFGNQLSGGFGTNNRAWGQPFMNGLQNHSLFNGTGQWGRNYSGLTGKWANSSFFQQNRSNNWLPWTSTNGSRLFLNGNQTSYFPGPLGTKPTFPSAVGGNQTGQARASQAASGPSSSVFPSWMSKFRSSLSSGAVSGSASPVTVPGTSFSFPNLKGGNSLF